MVRTVYVPAATPEPLAGRGDGDRGDERRDHRLRFAWFRDCPDGGRLLLGLSDGEAALAARPGSAVGRPRRVQAYDGRRSA